MRQYYKFNLKDTVGRTLKSSYISDEINNINKTTSSIYPSVIPVIVSLDVKKQLDSKSMSLMSLLDLKTLSEKLAVSDIISILALQNIGDKMFSMNNAGLTSYQRFSPCLFNFIDKRSLEYIWRLDAEKDEKLHIFYEANISLFTNTSDPTFPSDVIDCLNTYVNEKTDEVVIEPYKLLIGEKINIQGDGIYVPIFIILTPGIGEYFNVSENKRLFFTEYVKLLYTFLPIWMVSRLKIFKDYFNIL